MAMSVKSYCVALVARQPCPLQGIGQHQCLHPTAGGVLVSLPLCVPGGEMRGLGVPEWNTRPWPGPSLCGGCHGGRLREMGGGGGAASSQDLPFWRCEGAVRRSMPQAGGGGGVQRFGVHVAFGGAKGRVSRLTGPGLKCSFRTGVGLGGTKAPPLLFSKTVHKRTSVALWHSPIRIFGTLVSACRPQDSAGGLCIDLIVAFGQGRVATLSHRGCPAAPLEPPPPPRVTHPSSRDVRCMCELHKRKDRQTCQGWWQRPERRSPNLSNLEPSMPG